MMILWIMALFACGWPGPLDDVRVEAHRAGAGYWPANSALAVRESIAANFDAIEIDLILSADDVPILTHDPFIDRSLCTTNLYSPVREEIKIRDLSADELRDGFLCGGIPTPEHPNAEVLSAPLMTFDEAISMFELAAPDQLIHLDVKVEEPFTASAEVTAEAILSRWFAADLPNPWLVSANLGSTLKAFRTIGAVGGQDVVTQLILPYHPTGGSEVATGLGFTIPTLIGTQELVALALEADVDSIALHHELVSRHSVRVAKAEGFEVLLWTLNDRAALQNYLEWNIDGVITDYPDDAP
jgi:glycerophosphoryl diester phosphodiesterase